MEGQDFPPEVIFQLHHHIFTHQRLKERIEELQRNYFIPTISLHFQNILNN